MAVLNVMYASITDKGERSVNEDSLDIVRLPDGYGFILCDGLGGHGNGDVASQLVVSSIKDALLQNFSIEDGISYAQQMLMQKQVELNAQNSMKTTVTCLMLKDTKARFGYVGDSRIYCFEKAKYKLRSQDHSVPQMLVNRGEIKEKDIRHHEDRSRLLKVMGTPWESPKYQMVENIAVSTKTSFLLCSDGFWELIDEKMMCKTLKKSKTPQEWLQQMKEIVLQNGTGTNMDNYSAIAVFVR